MTCFIRRDGLQTIRATIIIMFLRHFSSMYIYSIIIIIITSFDVCKEPRIIIIIVFKYTFAGCLGKTRKVQARSAARPEERENVIIIII